MQTQKSVDSYFEEFHWSPEDEDMRDQPTGAVIVIVGGILAGALLAALVIAVNICVPVVAK